MSVPRPWEPALGLSGFLVLLLLGSGSASGQVPVQQATEGPDGGGRFQVSLAWLDPDRLLGAGFEMMAEEVRSIFAELKVDVAWKRGKGNTVDTGPGDLLVILLSAAPSTRLLGGDTMGAVNRDEGSQHVVFVFHDRIAEAIRIELDSPRTTPLQRRELATAVGRVVAHEVIHAVAPAHPHVAEAGGVMQPGLSAVQLVRGKLEIGSLCATAFLEGLAAETAAGP